MSGPSKKHLGQLAVATNLSALLTQLRDDSIDVAATDRTGTSIKRRAQSTDMFASCLVSPLEMITTSPSSVRNRVGRRVTSSTVPFTPSRVRRSVSVERTVAGRMDTVIWAR